MIYRHFSALPLLTLTVSASALAGPHLCWIDSVVLDGEGVRVIFSGSGWNHTGSTKSRGRFVIGHGDITWLSEPRQTEMGLLLKQSEGALLIGGVEDICTIEFAEVDGHKGINAHASVSLAFTGQPTEKTEFIQATDKSNALPK
jgi:hypothetical protein